RAPDLERTAHLSRDDRATHPARRVGPDRPYLLGRCGRGRRSLEDVTRHGVLTIMATRLHGTARHLGKTAVRLAFSGRRGTIGKVRRRSDERQELTLNAAQHLRRTVAYLGSTSVLVIGLLAATSAAPAAAGPIACNPAAQNFVWTGGAGTPNWNDGLNWNL